MSERYYTKEHEWLLVADDEVTIGITDHAQAELGDIVYVQLPNVGDVLQPGDEAATIESVKAASDIRAPLGGRVVAVNEALAQSPETVNQSPESEGWFFRMSPEGELPEDLLSHDQYRELLD